MNKKIIQNKALIINALLHTIEKVQPELVNDDSLTHFYEDNSSELKMRELIDLQIKEANNYLGENSNADT